MKAAHLIIVQIDHIRIYSADFCKRLSFKSLDIKKVIKSNNFKSYICIKYWQVECRGCVGESVFHVCFLMGTPIHMHLAKRMLKVCHLAKRMLKVCHLAKRMLKVRHLAMRMLKVCHLAMRMLKVYVMAPNTYQSSGHATI